MLHIQTVHEELKCPCEDCGRQFTDANNLGRHIKVIHEGINNFACEKCEKRFGSKRELVICQSS